jgi:N-acetylmuramoyl-L-alanine amidase
LVLLFFCQVFLSGPVAAQDLQAIARIDASKSTVTDRLLGGVSVNLSLSQPVPYRVFVLNDPKRLVFDFKEVDWAGFNGQDILNTDAVSGIRYGIFRPGWSRMVLDMAHPLAMETIELVTGASGTSATIKVNLENVTSEEFAKRTGAPVDDSWGIQAKAVDIEPKQRQLGDRPLVIAIDPGHGGIDPGAERKEHTEKQLVLLFGRELKEALILTGRYKAGMTRDRDEFVSLPERITRARAIQADVMISLHADALASGNASGTTVYTLSSKASDAAAASLAEHHDRSDLLAGVDLSRQDDVVAGVLMDMARVETSARSDALADQIVTGIADTVGYQRKRPHLSAGFSVLKAPDIPSILIELGFMSNKKDLDNLLTMEWRAKVIEGIIAALDSWTIEDAAQAQLLRK